MRLGTFLMGGIAGAAAVIYLSRKTSWMSFGNLMQAGDLAGKTSGKTKPNWSEASPLGAVTGSSHTGQTANTSFANSSSAHTSHASTSSAGFANSSSTHTNTAHNAASNTATNVSSTGKTGTSSADLSKVKEIVNEDPHLKVTVGEILAAGNQSDSAHETV